MPMTGIPFGISEEIRAELGRQRLSLRDLSKASGISYGSVLRKINHHSRSLSLGEFIALANALNIQASELIARAERALAETEARGGQHSMTNVTNTHRMNLRDEVTLATRPDQHHSDTPSSKH